MMPPGSPRRHFFLAFGLRARPTKWHSFPKNNLLERDRRPLGQHGFKRKQRRNLSLGIDMVIEKKWKMNSSENAPKFK
jgi:hypothetical protein